jgi:ABC-type antimicrobial peptide transport system ATPase subunit
MLLWSVVARADQIVMMHQGKVLEVGTRDQLMAKSPPVRISETLFAACMFTRVARRRNAHLPTEPSWP